MCSGLGKINRLFMLDEKVKRTKKSYEFIKPPAIIRGARNVVHGMIHLDVDVNLSANITQTHALCLEVEVLEHYEYMHNSISGGTVGQERVSEVNLLRYLNVYDRVLDLVIYNVYTGGTRTWDSIEPCLLRITDAEWKEKIFNNKF